MGKKGNNEAISAKKGKASKLNVIIYPAEGGHPYTKEVVPSKGSFTLDDTEESFIISPGSVFLLKGEPHTCVNSANPQTVNIHTLTGDDAVSPTMINGIIKNNMVEQVQKFAKTAKPWQQLKTISLMVMGLLFGFLLFWGIRELGNGFEAIEEAIRNIKIMVESSGTGSGGAAAGDSHQDIAPGGV